MRKLFYDDVYHFLYRSKMFQQLEEGEQQIFLQQFVDDEQFMESLATALDFQARLGKIEVAVPNIATYDSPSTSKGELVHQKLVLKDTITQGNVTYVPFRQKMDLVAPLIIGFDTSPAMESFKVQAKGLILPLLELCAMQQRDCIVLTEDEQFLFPHGQLLTTVVKGIQCIEIKKQTDIAQLYTQALHLFDLYETKQDAEFLLITANTFELTDMLDKNIRKLQAQCIELSAIALDEKQFEETPLPFLDKVFFPNS